MNILKRVLIYITWSLLAFLFAFVYMRIILGSKPESSSFFMEMFGWLYEYVFIYIALIIASVITFLFVLTDIFYLMRKLGNDAKSTTIRFFVLIVIAILVGSIHYILEKVIDVI